MGELQSDFCENLTEFDKSPLKNGLISQISVHILWHVCVSVQIFKLLNLIGCHGSIKGKFSKKYSKIFSSEAVKGMRLKICIHVQDISLYRIYVLYCRCPCALVAVAT